MNTLFTKKMNEKELAKTACELRLLVLESICSAGSGHPGGSLSCLDFLTYLYFNELRIDPEAPNKPDRDRFVLSKGHAAPALYAVLAKRGFFGEESLLNLRRMGSFLQGHPNMKTTPGVEMSTGSLGQGVSAACGMALGLKMNAFSSRVFCLLGDGELEEGQVYEALMFASHNCLNNLCLVVDNNGLQIDGSIESVAGLCQIAEKFKAFGFHVVEIDGHNFSEIGSAIEKFKVNQKSSKPFAIVLKTKKGCGVSFMENKVEWHGVAPTKEQYFLAKKELEAAVLKLNENFDERE